MKRGFVLTLLLTVGLAVAQGAWKTVSSTPGKFSAQMPGTPQVSTRTDREGGMTIPTTMYVASGGNTNYVLSFSVLEKNPGEKFIKDMMDGIKSGFLRSTNGTAVSDKAHTLNGYAGRLINFKIGNGASGALWMGFRSNRVFTLTVAKASGGYATEQKKFFGSFRIK